MKKIQITAIAFAATVFTVLGGMALAQQDKYTVKVPGGLAFSEFRGYEAGRPSPSVGTKRWSL